MVVLLLIVTKLVTEQCQCIDSILTLRFEGPIALVTENNWKIQTENMRKMMLYNTANIRNTDSTSD